MLLRAAALFAQTAIQSTQVRRPPPGSVGDDKAPGRKVINASICSVRQSINSSLNRQLSLYGLRRGSRGIVLGTVQILRSSHHFHQSIQRSDAQKGALADVMQLVPEPV